MQLTKAEIAETQIIVTTPEKWDVVTRKPTGEGEVASVSSLHNVKHWRTNATVAESQVANYRRSPSPE